MKAIYLFSLALVLTISQAFSQQSKSETLTNQSVISLVKAGLEKSIIITTIKNAKGNFDTTTNGIINLKKQGVPSEIISAIVNKKEEANSSPVNTATVNSAVKQTPETDLINNPFYFDKANNKAVTLEFVVAPAKLKINPLKLLVPTSSFPVVLRMEKEASSVKIPATAIPTFIVNCGATTTPEVTFGLYRFSIIKNNRRETVWQKVSGVPLNQDKDMVSFNYKKIKEGVYEIIPNAPLEKGEYCFVNRISFANYKEMKADVFAFGIE